MRCMGLARFAVFLSVVMACAVGLSEPVVESFTLDPAPPSSVPLAGQAPSETGWGGPWDMTEFSDIGPQPMTAIDLVPGVNLNGAGLYNLSPQGQGLVELNASATEPRRLSRPLAQPMATSVWASVLFTFRGGMGEVGLVLNESEMNPGVPGVTIGVVDAMVADPSGVHLMLVYVELGVEGAQALLWVDPLDAAEGDSSLLPPPDLELPLDLAPQLTSVGVAMSTMGGATPQMDALYISAAPGDQGLQEVVGSDSIPTGLTAQILCSAIGPGSITPGTTNLAYGESATFEFTPDEGAFISDVEVDGVSTGAPSSYAFMTIQTNHELTVTFAMHQIALEVVSARGVPTPAAGTHSFDWGQEVACSVLGSPERMGRTQYVCTGWVGTGDVPATGQGTNVVVGLEWPSRLTWHWQLQYEVGLVVDGAGSILPAAGWFPAGGSTAFTPHPQTGHHFVGWSGDVPAGSENDNPLELGLAGPVELTAAFEINSYELSVASQYGHGDPTPSVGSSSYTHGAQVACSVDGTTVVDGDTRYVHTGWSGSGSVPASGSGTTVDVTVVEASTLTWTWQQQHRISVGRQGEGTLSYETAWHPEGAILELRATPGHNYHFVRWEGDVPAGAEALSTIQVAVDQPRSLTAVFAHDTTVLYISGPPSGTQPPAGEHVVLVDSAVTCRWDQASHVTNGVRYRCTGWTTSTGSGTSSTVVVGMPYAQSLQWLYETDYYLTVTGTTHGALSPASGWFAAETEVLVTATPDENWRVASLDHHAYTDLWRAPTGHVATTLYMDHPQSVGASFSPALWRLQVNSSYGDVLPAVGTHWVEHGATVSCAVASSPVSVHYTGRAVCTGWEASGLAMGSGSGTNLEVVVSNHVDLSWNWELQQPLVTAIGRSGGGSVSPSEGWFRVGSMLSITSVPSTGHHLGWWYLPGGRWVPDTACVEVRMPNYPCTVEASFDLDRHSYTMLKTAPWADPQERHGTYGARYTASVEPDYVEAGTRYLCTGWLGTGSIAASGATHTTSFLLEEDSSIEWRWREEYGLGLTSQSGGVVLGEEGWYQPGSAVSVTGRVDEPNCHLVWTGDVPESNRYDNPLTVVMDEPRSIRAAFPLDEYTYTFTSAIGDLDDGHGFAEQLGTDTLVHGTYRQVLLPQAVVTVGHTSYTYTGWSGTGDAPLAETASRLTFQATQPTAVQFNWQTSYWQSVSAGARGSVNAGSGWYAAHTSVTCVATAEAGYYFNRWVGDVPAGQQTNSQITLVVDKPKSVTALFEESLLLDVVSQSPQVSPQGIVACVQGETVSCTVLEPLQQIGTNARVVCDGWIGEGDVPVSGSGTNVSFTMTQDSRLEWLWRTDYWLTHSVASGRGTVLGTEGWRDASTPVVLTARPTPGNHFVEWTGGVPEAQRTQNPLILHVAEPTHVTARFAGQPRVTDVRGYFAGVPRALMGAKCVGVEKQAVFLKGLPLVMEFVPTASWEAAGSGSFEFQITDRDGVLIRTDQMSGSSKLYDMGFLPAAAYRIRVVAVAADGTRSLPYTVNCISMHRPIGPMYVLLQPPLVSSQVYEAFPVDVDLFSPLSATAPSSDSAGTSIPGMQSRSLSLAPSVSGRGEISLLGEASQEYGLSISSDKWATTKKSFGVKLGFGFSPKVSGTAQQVVQFPEDGSAAIWGPATGTLGIGVDAYVNTPTAYVVPFVYVKGRGDVSISVVLAITGYDDAGNPILKGQLPIEPSITLTAGAGVDAVCSLEVSGTVGLPVTFDFDLSDPVSKFQLELSAKAVGHFLFYNKTLWSTSYEHSFLSASGSSLSAASLGSEPIRLSTMEPDTFEIIPRGYLQRRPSEAAGLQAASVVLDHGVEQVLQVDQYPLASPDMVLSGDAQLMGWVRDNPERSIGNHLEFVVADRTNGVWGAAATVWDDGTSDMAGQLGMAADGTLFAAWQNLGVVMGESNGLSVAMAHSEIAVGVRDPVTGVWVVTNLTDDLMFDRSPQLAVSEDGKALVVWPRNEGLESAFFGSKAAPNAVLASHWDGAGWSAPSVLATNVGMMFWPAAAYKGSEGVVLYTVDPDDDDATLEDQELYGLLYAEGQWTTPRRLTDNAVRDTHAQPLYAADGGLRVAWFQDGSIVINEGLDLRTPEIIAEVGHAPSAVDFALLAGAGGRVGMVFQEWNGNTHMRDPHLICYDPNVRVWGRPMPLKQDATDEHSFVGGFTADGAIRLAYSRATQQHDEGGVVTNSIVALCALDYDVGRDLAVYASDIALVVPEGEGAVTGIVHVTVHNVGELAVTNPAVAVYNGIPSVETQVGDVRTIPYVVAAGTSAVVRLDWPMPETPRATTIYAVVDPTAQVADRDRANNMAWLAALQPDLQLAGIGVSRSNASVRTLSVGVENAGRSAVATSFDLTAYCGAPDGPRLASCMVPELAAGGHTNVVLSVDLAGLASTAAYEHIWVVVDASNQVAEADETDNTRHVRVVSAHDDDNDGLLDGDELEAGSNPRLQDSDGDGVSDPDELQLYGTLATLRDSDRDGVDDGDELIAGTNPMNPKSYLRIEKITPRDGGSIVVQWSTEFNRHYTISSSSNMLDTFVPLTQALEGIPPANCVTVQVDRATSRFYRIDVGNP